MCYIIGAASENHWKQSGQPVPEWERPEDRAGVMNGTYTPNTECVGLIADTHGRAEPLSMAIRELVRRKARNLFHLGDFLDSVYVEEIDEVVQLIQDHDVLPIMGNNDYQVMKTLFESERQYPGKQNGLLGFLKQIPLRSIAGSICFAHSLPFGDFRSFYEPIDTGTTSKASEIFNKTQYKILFCGHSHESVFFRCDSGVVTRERAAPGQRIEILEHQRYIFIVGSAEKGECGLYNSRQGYYERIMLT